MSDTGIDLRDGAHLDRDKSFSSLVRAWFADEAAGATAAWRRALDAPSAAAPAPAWATAAWREPWWDGFAADLPDEAARATARASVDALAASRADTIVTGQQPGFLGGPLYTLFKAAACVAAAEARRAAGLPTVPLFWLGDDDDDLREAFDVRVWDPRRQALLRPEVPVVEPSSTIGGLPAALAGYAERDWLRERAGTSPTAARLAELWDRALAEGLGWGRLHRRVLATLFADRGLLVVSGDDPALHAAAAPLYTRLVAERSELAERAREAGKALAADGHPAQIGERSLSRPFGVADGPRRLRLGDGEPPPSDPSRLRPGVLFRSPVQDWLFRPTGVIVGPGEYAYLKQLEPVYAALDLPRAQLLPRLFGEIAPRGRSTGETTGRTARRDPLLASLDETAGRALRDAVASAFPKAGAAAEDLIRGALDAWSSRNATLFDRLSAAAAPVDRPLPWSAPDGELQERRLAAWAALAVWGDCLVDAAVRAAAAHFETGRAGVWRRRLFIVDDTDVKGTES